MGPSKTAIKLLDDEILYRFQERMMPDMRAAALTVIDRLISVDLEKIDPQQKGFVRRFQTKLSIMYKPPSAVPYVAAEVLTEMLDHGKNQKK